MRRFNPPLAAGLSLAAISLYCSSNGLIHLFPGAPGMIGVLAVLFELAKVSTTMYLLKHFRWRPLPLALGVILVVLTGISSIGIYGTLGRAYNVGRSSGVASTVAVNTGRSDLNAYERDRDRLFAQIDAIPAEQGSNRRRALSQLAPQIRTLDSLILLQRAHVSAAATSEATIGNEIGDLQYAATLFGVTQEKLAMGIITTLAFLLDPLALLLLLASGVKDAPIPVAGEVREAVSPPPAPRVVALVKSKDGLSAGLSTILQHFKSKQSLDSS